VEQGIAAQRRRLTSLLHFMEQRPDNAGSYFLEFRQKRVSIGILEEISKIVLEKTNAPHYSTPI
jgi:hypothetical protein